MSEKKSETDKKYCDKCMHYEYVDHSDWAHTIIFHNCLHPNKRLKWDSDCINNRNKNNNCKWFKKGDSINTINSEKSIERQKRVDEKKELVAEYDRTGRIPSQNPVVRFIKKLFCVKR